jgi:hypothetical protein
MFGSATKAAKSAKKPKSAEVRKDYERHKQRNAAAQREKSARARDIAPSMPDVANPRRRARCKTSLRLFCKTYLPRSFYLKFSSDHEQAIRRIEQSVLRGGLFAFAMPRGSGKTALCLAACEWAILYGHHQFVALVAATQTKAESLLEDVWMILQTNDLLLADFPEVCYPIRRLEGVAQRRLLYRGHRIRMKCKKDTLILPDLPGSVSASAILKAAGLSGAAIRGMRLVRPDGDEVRPSVVICDDPQTDESAKSVSQVRYRLDLLNGAVLGMAGPGKHMSGIMPCTVIEHNDLADQCLDQKKNPQWSGERTKLLYAFPTNMKLWDEYHSIRAQEMRSKSGHGRSDRFYRANRRAMDAGSSVGWDERKAKGDLSALQHAMNLWFDRGEKAFNAEYQNDPIKPISLDTQKLTADEITERINRIPQSIAPAGSTVLTAFIDVQQDVLFWAVCAWKPDFTGSVIEYGAWPDQATEYFTLARLRQKLRDLYPRGGIEGAWYAGIQAVTSAMCRREWKRDDGAILRLKLAMVDANDGNATDTVYQAIRESEFAALLMPSHGVGIGASGKPMAERQLKPGDELGLNWIKYNETRGRAIGHVTHDVNWWKSFLFGRLATSIGDGGALTLFGEAPERHRMLAEHLTAETFKRTTLKGTQREVDEWSLMPGRDNHWLDCIVGCAVAASLEGVSRPDTKADTFYRETFVVPDHLRSDWQAIGDHKAWMT